MVEFKKVRVHHNENAEQVLIITSVVLQSNTSVRRAKGIYARLKHHFLMQLSVKSASLGILNPAVMAATNYTSLLSITGTPLPVAAYQLHARKWCHALQGQQMLPCSSSSVSRSVGLNLLPPESQTY